MVFNSKKVIELLKKSKPSRSSLTNGDFKFFSEEFLSNAFGGYSYGTVGKKKKRKSNTKKDFISYKNVKLKDLHVRTSLDISGRRGESLLFPGALLKDSIEYDFRHAENFCEDFPGLYTTYTTLEGTSRTYPTCQTIISLMPNRKTLSITTEKLERFRPRNYNGVGTILYEGYDYVPHKKMVFKIFPDENNRLELKDNGITMSYTFNQIPDKGGVVNELLSRFLEVPLQELGEEYNKRAFPAYHKLFPKVDVEEMNPLMFFPGWKEGGEVTLTSVLAGVLVGGKPRKDFVRAFAHHVNSLANKEDMSIPRRYIPYVLIGAVNLINFSRTYDMGFDVEDAVIKNLQSYTAKIIDRDTVSFSSPLHAFGVERHKMGDSCDLLHPIRNFARLEHSMCAISSFVKPNLMKKMISNRFVISFDTNVSNDNIDYSVGRLFVDYQDTSLIHDLALAIFLTSGKSFDDWHLNTDEYYAGGERKKAAIQEIKDLLHHPQRDIQDEYFHNEDTFTGLHNTVIMLDSVKNHQTLEGETPDTPAKMSLSKASLSRIYHNEEEYSLYYPESYKDVVNWAMDLKNCMFIYQESIKDNAYELIFIKKEGKPYAAMGYNIEKEPMKNGEYASHYMLDEFSRKKSLLVSSELKQKILLHFENSINQHAKESGQMVKINNIRRAA